MIWRLAYKNVTHQSVMYFLMLIQMIVVFFITISMSSSIYSRFTDYLPFRDVLDGQGTYYDITADVGGPNNDADLLGSSSAVSEELSGHPDIAASYLVPAYEIKEGYDFRSYDDFWLEIYEPELEEGTWFDLKNWTKEDTIPVVISQNDKGLHVGDTFVMNGVAPRSTICNLEVIGVLRDGAKIIGSPTESSGPDFSCKDMYENYYFDVEEETLVMIPYSLLPVSNGKAQNALLFGPLLVTYPESPTAEEKKANDEFFGAYMSSARMEISEIKKNSFDYIFEDTRVLLPILLAVMILSCVSAMSVNALSTKRQIYNYTIYYICGLKWKKCVQINLVSSLYLVFLALLITILGVVIMGKAGLLANSVITLGGFQLLSCALVALLYVLLSIVLPLRIMSSNTPSQILQSN